MSLRKVFYAQPSRPVFYISRWRRHRPFSLWAFYLDLISDITGKLGPRPGPVAGSVDVMVESHERQVIWCLIDHPYNISRTYLWLNTEASYGSYSCLINASIGFLVGYGQLRAMPRPQPQPLPLSCFLGFPNLISNLPRAVVIP